MTKIVSFFKSKRGKKLGAVFLLVVIVFSSFSISSSAASYQTIAPIEFNDFSHVNETSAVAFPGGHTVPLYYNGETLRDYLNDDDYNAYDDRIGTFLKDGQYLPTIQIHFVCGYASVNVNGTVYDGSTDPSNCSFYPIFNLSSFICYPASVPLDPYTNYYYQWTIVLGEYFDYNFVYDQGFQSGVKSESAMNYWYENLYGLGYTDGYDDCLDNFSGTSGDSFGDTILGVTFSGPMKALNSFVLYESASGLQVTLGGVLGACICLSIFLAFIKIFT